MMFPVPDNAACKGCSVAQNDRVGFGADTDGVREWVNGLNLR